VLFQKVFSRQISRAVNKMRDDFKLEVAEDGTEDLDLKDAFRKTAKVLAFRINRASVWP